MRGIGVAGQGSFDDVMTFSTRLGLADIFSRFRWSILRTGFLFQCNLYTVLQSLSNLLFPSYNSNVLRMWPSLTN